MMRTLFALAFAFLLVPSMVRAQSNIYELSAAINLGFGVIQQMLNIQRQMSPHHPGWGYPSSSWPQACEARLMRVPVDRMVIVDSCTGRILHWVR